MIAWVRAGRRVVCGRPLEAQPGLRPLLRGRYRLAPDGTSCGGEWRALGWAKHGRPWGLQSVACGIPGCAGDLPSLWSSWKDFLDPRMCFADSPVTPWDSRQFSGAVHLNFASEQPVRICVYTDIATDSYRCMDIDVCSLKLTWGRPYFAKPM